MKDYEKERNDYLESYKLTLPNGITGKGAVPYTVLDIGNIIHFERLARRQAYKEVIGEIEDIIDLYILASPRNVKKCDIKGYKQALSEIKTTLKTNLIKKMDGK